jgi:hypothetical protein
VVPVKTSPEDQKNLVKMCMSTFLVYRQIEKGKHPYITQDAVKYMSVYCSAEVPAGLEDLDAGHGHRI